MSAELMGRVWKLNLSHAKQLIMLALADHAHDDGTQCYPGVPYLAWKTGYSERNVTRVLGELEFEDKIIESVDGGDGGRRYATEYVLKLDNGIQKDEFKKKMPRRKGDNPNSKKGDNSNKKGDKPAQKGDNSPRADIEEPSVEPSENHSPNGATADAERQKKQSPKDFQSRYIATLHERLRDRGLLDQRALTKSYKDQLSGELREHLKTHDEATLWAAQDQIVARWKDTRLPLWQAIDDVTKPPKTNGHHPPPDNGYERKPVSKPRKITDEEAGLV